jgi:hypothetical protein
MYRRSGTQVQRQRGIELGQGGHSYVLSESRFTETLTGASSFRATNGFYRNCATTRHPAVDFQVVFHAQSACFGSIVDDVDHLCLASLLWITYGLLNRKPAIYAGNIIGLVMDFLMVNGILMQAGWTY